MNVTLGRWLDRYVGVPLCAVLFLLGRLLPSTRRVLNRAPKRILVIKLFGLGNVIELMPALHSLREHFPEAHLTVLTLESNAGVLEGFGPVDDLLYFKDSNWAAAMVCAARLMPALYARRFELVLDMDPIGRFCTLLSFSTRAPWRVGFATRGQYREQLYTDTITLRQDQHIRRIFLDLLEPLGIRHAHLPALVPPPVAPGAAQVIAARLADLPGDGPLVLVNPNASPVAYERRWPLERFAALLTALAQVPGIRLVLVGAPSEKAHVDQLMAALPPGLPVHPWAGTTTLPQLSALIAKADLFISNDSGPLHLASAHDVPTVGLFGPESPARYGPVGAHHKVLYSGRACSPCMHFSNEKRVRCPYGVACMSDLSVGAAVDAARAQLARHEPKRRGGLRLTSS